MGNSQMNTNPQLTSKQGDLSKLISSYLQERGNTFTVLNAENKNITKSNLSKVLDSKSILNNAKLLSFKVFTQYNSQYLNANNYQSNLVSSSLFSNCKDEMIQLLLNETNKLIKDDPPIYQKKLTIKTNTVISHIPSDINSNTSSIRNKNQPLLKSNSYCLDHAQISYQCNNGNSHSNNNSRLNQSEFIQEHSSKPFDDMNLREYLNEETKNIRLSVSLRHDNENTIKVDNEFNKHIRPNSASKQHVNKKKLTIESNTNTIKTKKKTKDNERYNTINYNALYDHEYFNIKHENHKEENTIDIKAKAPMKTEYNLNLINNKYISLTNVKSTSYQSFRSGIKTKQIDTSVHYSTKKNTIAIGNVGLAKKPLSTALNKKDSLIKVLKKDKIVMNTLPNAQINKSHLLSTPKTSRVTSPKTSFTTKPVTSYSSRNISYIANQNNGKQNNPVFNIKIDLRELMKDDDNEDVIIKKNSSTIDVNDNKLLSPDSSMMKDEKRDYLSKHDRNSHDRSSLEGLIITHQKIDVNGKISLN